MSAVGDIIHVTGRPERITERVPIHHPESGVLMYYALKAEPVGDEPTEPIQGSSPAL